MALKLMLGVILLSSYMAGSTAIVEKSRFLLDDRCKSGTFVVFEKLAMNGARSSEFFDLPATSDMPNAMILFNNDLFRKKTHVLDFHRGPTNPGDNIIGHSQVSYDVR